MDDLVLASVGLALERSLVGTVLEDLREEPGQRIRLVFVSAESHRSLLVCFNPTLPWLGRPVVRAPTPIPPTPFATTCLKSLRGRVVLEARREGPRCAALSFAGGCRLVVELIPSRANVVLLAADATVTAVGRWTKGTAERLAPGMAYRPPDLPAGRVDSMGPTPVLEDGVEQLLIGISRESVQLALEEAALEQIRPGEVMAARAAGLVRGELEPVVESIMAPLEAAERGELAPATCRLLPWRPRRPPPPGFAHYAGEDAAATAGLFFEALQLRLRLQSRFVSLQGVLERELRKTRRSRARVESDLTHFAEPERHRVHGEALLAGLHSARRFADHVLVPDPYDIEGSRSLSIPAPPGQSLQEVAAQQFRLHRRAKRGLESCRERAARLDAHRERLAALSRLAEGQASHETLASLERGLRDAGVPVGLERVGTKQAPSPSHFEKPRVEGVRLLHASDGSEILVGRGGRENDRLTFKLAGPEDFWFHARDVPGAHVIVRNPARHPRPAERLGLEAAAVAAWFSDARSQAQADVIWTRRKYVRRAKGAPAGTVTIKKSETLRVRPALPAGAEG